MINNEWAIYDRVVDTFLSQWSEVPENWMWDELYDRYDEDDHIIGKLSVWSDKLEAERCRIKLTQEFQRKNLETDFILVRVFSRNSYMILDDISDDTV